MMPTPAIYAAGIKQPFNNLQQARKSSQIEVLYATDRAPGEDETGRLTYGSGRSPSLAFGTANVEIGNGVTWEQLVEDAQTSARAVDLNLSLSSVEELARMPATPYPFTMENGRPVTVPEFTELVQSSLTNFKQAVVERLAGTPRKEVFIFVHGVQNSFSDAVFASAEIWHYLGREGVPIVYTWPAGGGGLLTGYTYDRESSEFTIYHFKDFLRTVADISEVERISILAHSRGTDVVLSSLRELFIETWAGGGDPKERFRIRNLVLASPDIDMEVLLQRSASERVPAGVHRATVYAYKQDNAIGSASLLFDSGRRLGKLDETYLQEQAWMKERATSIAKTNVALVEYTGPKGGDFGHNYFRTNPAVASDVVLTVRYDRDPGSENGRPLKLKSLMFWEIGDDYLTPTVK